MRRALLASILLVVGAGGVAAQGQPALRIERGDGSSSTVAVRLDRGYATVPLTVLEDLGWSVREDGAAVTLTAAGEITVSLRANSPFFRWDGVVLQLTDAPYRAGGSTFVPLQFLTDFLPRRLPGLYDFSGERSLLRAGDLSLLGAASSGGGTAAADTARSAAAPEGAAGGATPPPPATGGGAEPARDRSGGGGAAEPRAGRSPQSVEEARASGPSPYDGVRVVVIDAGHGGEDPGALGPGGLREKDVALGIAKHLEELLRRVPQLEVHMIRDDDTFVDLWERGQIATDVKGERPGVFVSIHANSFPARRAARGFETYFLSDARTEHERRVSAIENAPLHMDTQNGDEEQTQDLDFILRDLRNLDHAHWSEDLAGLVQEELDTFHPGPDRGVKQGVLAVLTNALMPSILVEVGYLSNADEARLIGTDDFHRKAAEAIANAVTRFFEHYPPGSGTGGTREDR